MSIITLAFAAATTGGDEASNIVSLIVTTVVSATVFSSLITGFIQYLNNRRNSRVTERRNAVDEESDVVTRYREQAVEERLQKESAVKTIKELLSESKEQITALKGTVETLNNTIALMKDLNAAQGTVIQQLTNDRDRTAAALERAEARVEAQKEELRKKQEEIVNLLEQSRTREEAARIVTETFGIVQDVVE